MTWAEISTIGPWGMAMLVGIAVYRGDLRLAREFTILKGQMESLEKTNVALAKELKDLALDAQRAMVAEKESTRKELAELRKTNDMLVTRLADRLTT